MDPVDSKDYLRRAILHRLDPERNDYPNPVSETK